MKKIIVVVISVCIVISCSKSGNSNSNALAGTWAQVRTFDQFKNPYSQLVDYDTLWTGSYPVEFRKDGGYYESGTHTQDYTIKNGNTFILTPPGQVPVEYNFIISDNELKTWRNGMTGEQIKVSNPDMSGEYIMAAVDQVFSEYVKQP